MPPENSCGYWRARRSGSVMRTARSRSTARASACLRPMPWWWRATSASWAPIRVVGLNEVIGSWKTIASEVPSNLPVRLGVRRRAGRCREARGVGVDAAGRPRPAAAIASAVSDLPDPDSPTTPTASPRRRRRRRRAPGGRAGRPGEGDPQVADVEHQVVGAGVRGPRRQARRRCRGSSVGAAAATPATSPSPSTLATASPNRLKARPASTTARPGASAAAGLT